MSCNVWRGTSLSSHPRRQHSLIWVGGGLCGHVTHRPSKTTSGRAPVSLSREVTRSRNIYLQWEPAERDPQSLRVLHRALVNGTSVPPRLAESTDPRHGEWTMAPSPGKNTTAGLPHDQATPDANRCLRETRFTGVVCQSPRVETNLMSNGACMDKQMSSIQFTGLF